MRALATGIVAVAAGLPLAVFAACENPTLVTVPDGAKATKEELLAAQGNVKTYMAAVEAYLACINEEMSAAGEDAPEEFKALMTTRYNSAVTEMETVAAKFNEQVRAYRAANPEAE